MKIVADTNVIFSMLLWGKSLERLFNMINRGRIVLCFSPETIDELFKVCHYPHVLKQAQKLKIDIDPLLDELLSASNICHPTEKINYITEDPSDNRFLETALIARAVCIISGDQHLLKIKKFSNIPIYKPAKFLKLFT